MIIWIPGQRFDWCSGGFDIEDVFVVGYGLDYNGWYRNLPYVEVLRPEFFGERVVR